MRYGVPMPQQKRFSKEFEDGAVRLDLTCGGRWRLVGEDLGIGLSTLTRRIGQGRDRKPYPSSEVGTGRSGG